MKKTRDAEAISRLLLGRYKRDIDLNMRRWSFFGTKRLSFYP